MITLEIMVYGLGFKFPVVYLLFYVFKLICTIFTIYFGISIHEHQMI
jgi:hypothetical protein